MSSEAPHRARTKFAYALSSLAWTNQYAIGMRCALHFFVTLWRTYLAGVRRDARDHPAKLALDRLPWTGGSGKLVFCCSNLGQIILLPYPRAGEQAKTQCGVRGLPWKMACRVSKGGWNVLMQLRCWLISDRDGRRNLCQPHH